MTPYSDCYVDLSQWFAFPPHIWWPLNMHAASLVGDILPPLTSSKGKTPGSWLDNQNGCVLPDNLLGVPILTSPGGLCLWIWYWQNPWCQSRNQMKKECQALKEGLWIQQEVPSLNLQISVGFSPFMAESREESWLTAEDHLLTKYFVLI